MSQADRDRLLTLKKAKKRPITQREGAEELGVGVRHVKRLLYALKNQGDKAVIHGLRGRPSNRKIPESIENEAVKILSAPVYKFETGLDDSELVRYHTTLMTRVHLTRVRRAGVKDQVFEQLRDGIMERTWPPGAKIPSENALAVALGVSRVSIREALQMLASLGLSETRQGGGTYVREYSGEIFLNPLLPMLALDTPDILHVLEYRKIVEKGIVSLVVKRAGKAEIEELESAFRAMEGHRNDTRAFAQADLTFHLALAKATGNPVVMKVNAVITDVLKVSMYGIVGSLGTRDGLYYHRRILDAIKARDGPRAESLMEEHVERTIRRLKRKRGGDRKSCAGRKTDGKA